MDFKEIMKRRIWAHVIILIISLLVALSAYIFLDGEMRRNFIQLGIVLAVVKVVRIISCTITLNSDEKVKRLEISEKDERNLSIARKAKSAAFFISVIAFAIVSYIMGIAGYSEIAKAIFFCVCFMLIVYYFVYLILQRNG